MNNKTNMIDNQEQGVDLDQLVNGEYKRGFREGQKQAMRELSLSLTDWLGDCRKDCEELLSSLLTVGTMSRIISEVRTKGAELSGNLAWLNNDFHLVPLASGIQTLLDGMEERVDAMDQILNKAMVCCDTLASHPSRLSSDAGSNQSPNSEESR